MGIEVTHSIPVLEKSIRVVQAIAAGGEGATSGGLARQLGISQSTCYRILQTLVAADWIYALPTGGYRMSAGMLPLVQPLLGLERLGTLLQPMLESLALATGVAAKASWRQGLEQLTLARAESPRPIAVSGRVGVRYPVVLGASGAALLSPLTKVALARILADTPLASWGHESPAELEQRLAACHDQGYCTNLGHHPQGIDTLSAPLATYAGPLAITLIGLQGDFAGERLPACVQHLLAAVSQAATQFAIPL